MNEKIQKEFLNQEKEDQHQKAYVMSDPILSYS